MVMQIIQCRTEIVFIRGLQRYICCINSAFIDVNFMLSISMNPFKKRAFSLISTNVYQLTFLTVILEDMYKIQALIMVSLNVRGGWVNGKRFKVKYVLYRIVVTRAKQDIECLLWQLTMPAMCAFLVKVRLVIMLVNGVISSESDTR